MSHVYVPTSPLPLGYGVPEVYHCIRPKPNDTIVTRTGVTSLWEHRGPISYQFRHHRKVPRGDT